MAFTSEKGWWRSRTVWVGLIATLYSALTILGIDLPLGIGEEVLTEAVLGVVGLLAIVFRVKATAPISTSIAPGV